jgi:hypothetical protein
MAGMHQEKHISEVSRLMEQIEAEYQAAESALKDPRTCGSHQIINGHLLAINPLFDQLAEEVGDKDDAIRMFGSAVWGIES